MMQQLDPHTLFSIFEQGDEEIYKEHGMEDVLNNPYVLIGMVIRGLENYTIMDMMYMRSYPEQYKSVRDTVKLKYYNGLYAYLTRIKLDSFEARYTVGETYDSQDVLFGLDTLLYFYEELEMYEKCAVIKQYMDLVRESTNKKVVCSS
jgi:hypothetical protein